MAQGVEENQVGGESVSEGMALVQAFLPGIWVG